VHVRVARALYQTVERMSPSPRLFSSTEETNAVAIQMHTALGFHASGYIDNLPQGYRELLFYKRLAPEGRRIRAGTYEVGGLERPRADYRSLKRSFRSRTRSDSVSSPRRRSSPLRWASLSQLRYCSFARARPPSMR